MLNSSSIAELFCSGFSPEAATRAVKIVALTDIGHRLAQKIQALIPAATVWFKPKPFSDHLQQAFTNGDCLILICASGIAVRTLAPVIQDKKNDPPVLVVDELGRYVVPLLSGHEGGANHLANELARALSAQPVITSACTYTDPVYTVGMGCERHCSLEELSTLLQQCLSEVGLNINQISYLSSHRIKQDEVGLIALAEQYQRLFVTFDSDQLAVVEPLLSTRSQYVFDTVGVYGVAESGALLAASLAAASSSVVSGVAHHSTDDQKSDPLINPSLMPVEIRNQTSKYPPELVLNKVKSQRATCAVARAYRGTL